MKIPEPIHGGSAGPVDPTRAREAAQRAHELLGDKQLRDILEHHVGNDTPVPRQVFVNRNLHLSNVELVGFDMDYTLAIYHLRRIEELSYDMTVDRLVSSMGYPEVIREIAYDHAFVMRGLFIDKRYGNLLKIDRFGHVGQAYHGRTPLPAEDLARLYHNERIRLKNTEYAWVDTLFALPEAALFAGIVDLYEQKLKRPLGYVKLYDDIREAIDTVHRDNSLKAVIRENIARYIFKDPELGPALHKLRSGGKKLFILTNSQWGYTRVVMEYLLDGVVPEYPSWKNYFDFIITGAAKPAFFAEERPFHEIDTNDDLITKLGEAKSLERGKVYEGGNLVAFEAMTGFAGDAVLYVGDHIYGDILKSRKTSMWRTCMVVQEIEDEITYLESRREQIDRLGELEQLQARLDDEIAGRKVRLNQIERRLDKEQLDEVVKKALEDDFKHTKSELDHLRKSLKETNQLVRVLDEDIVRGFNAYWGLHFKEGPENTRFGEQVEQSSVDGAKSKDRPCLYTSRVSNFGFYSPMHVFRSAREVMPHESAGALSGKLGRTGTEGLPKGTLRAGDIP